jgi:hypothetical protein
MYSVERTHVKEASDEAFKGSEAVGNLGDPPVGADFYFPSGANRIAIRY